MRAEDPHPWIRKGYFMSKIICYTKKQKRIMQHDTGVGVVGAGAGTGKTQTLIGTITTLLNKYVGVKILVFNHSHDASRAFKVRLQHGLGYAADAVHVVTIHAFGFALIRKFYKELGFTRIPKVFKAVKNKLSARVKLKRNIIDYDDMITMPLQLFEKYPTILEAVTNRFTDFMVDELQDVDKKQAMLIELLAAKMVGVLLVGDPKQAIYGYRNAGVKHWDRLVKNLAPKHFVLTQTQRIPDASLAFVNSFAASFSDDLPLISDVVGYKPELYRFENPDAQANFIAITIEELIKAGVDPSEIACLGRFNIPLLHLKVALEARGIMTVQRNYSKILEKWSKALGALICMVKWISNQQLPTNIIVHCAE